MKNKFKGILKTLGLTVVMVVLSCVMAFAADGDGGATVDVVTILSDSATSVVNTLIATLAAVIGIGMGFFTVKLGISYGIKFLKQILGKMS